MKRVLVNTSRATVNTTYNGKPYFIGPKKSITLDHNGRDEFAADYLLQTYGFLKDITPKPKVTLLPIRNSYGEKVL